jgi:Mg2+/citrate symporter
VQSSTKQFLLYWAAAILAIVAVVLLLLGVRAIGVGFLAAAAGALIVVFPTYRGP